MDHEEAISIVQITFFLLTLFEYFLTMNLGRQEIEQEGYPIFLYNQPIDFQWSEIAIENIKFP